VSTHPPLVACAAELASIVALGAATYDAVRVVERDARMDEPLARAADAMRARAEPAGRIADVRQMYKRVGVDPTKTRPSSEALLRRIRRGDGIPRINSLVDVINWCSLELQLPYGLYDLDRVSPPFELRLGRPGESYAGIRKDDVHLGGRLTLADAAGPFGNPTSDSLRAMVTPATTRALVVVYAPSAARASLAPALDLTLARAAEFTGAVETARTV
jgi:DNA/RNA-binding domain of Phe-tRNA-synthetase-like protein